MNETHSDTALQIVGAVAAVAHGMSRAVDSVDMPGEATITANSVTVTGVAPEVVDIIAGKGEHPVTPYWSKYAGSMTRAYYRSMVNIEGVFVHIESVVIEGTFSTEFVRSEK